MGSVARELLGPMGDAGSYTEEQLIRMDHADLMMMRQQNKTRPGADEFIAPYEHRAFARETTQANPPVNAAMLLFAIPAYYAAKSLGVNVNTNSSAATPASTEQMRQGFYGVWDGLKNPSMQPGR